MSDLSSHSNPVFLHFDPVTLDKLAMYSAAMGDTPPPYSDTPIYEHHTHVNNPGGEPFDILRAVSDVDDQGAPPINPRVKTAGILVGLVAASALLAYVLRRSKSIDRRNHVARLHDSVHPNVLGSAVTAGAVGAA